MKYKLVIFDLDGTILDTLDDLCASVNFALEKNNLSPRTRDEVRAFVGNGIKLLVERAVPENTPEYITDSVFADFKNHYAVHNDDNTKSYDGIVQVIDAIRNKGMKTAVISNKTDPAVQLLIEKHFPGLFDYVAGEKDGIKRKPAPDSVVRAVCELQCALNETLFIGDSEVDLMTSENAGVDCIAVSWGFRDKEQLEAKGAKIIIEDVSVLTDQIFVE